METGELKKAVFVTFLTVYNETMVFIIKVMDSALSVFEHVLCFHNFYRYLKQCFYFSYVFCYCLTSVLFFWFSRIMTQKTLS